MRGPLSLLLLLALVAVAAVGAFGVPWLGHDGPTMRDAQAVVHRVREDAPQLFMGPEELASAQGFGLEAHTVRTEDGYLLTLHRLAPPATAPAGDEGDRGEPVLLVHGIFCASDLWLLTPRHHALAFLLADKGYDVWLANLRGNPYSRRHESLSTQDLAFWNFSWHEMGVYDLPACMDLILKATRRERLFYVGHSMGNTAYYAMAAARPDVGARVRLHVGLAPAVFMAHIPNQVARVAARSGDRIVRALESSHAPELLPASAARTALLFLSCQPHASRALCRRTFEMTYGPAHPAFNESLIPFYAAHVLQSSSARTPGHFAQLVLSGRFRQWDEGSAEGNQRRYGRPEPPDYDLGLVSAPSAIFYSDDDLAVSPTDVEHLMSLQKNVVYQLKVPDRPYNHMDFLWTPSAVQTLYDPIFKLLAQF
ncbi:hypothetical protein R5R35_001460 [Gryllus longicercus]|uniref:Lipase n=1 Tax=Gryllus longicercus TaxID=2509291 RepID=A0AAN9Z6A9_9ORTH